MIEIAVNTYQAKIGGYENCTWVRYKIDAYDNAENHAVNDNEGYYYVYHVIPEFSTTVIMLLLLFLVTISLLITKLCPQAKIYHKRICKPNHRHS